MTATRTSDVYGGAGGSSRAACVLVSCTRCHRLHRGEPLEFNPVCAACATEHDALRWLGMRALDGEPAPCTDPFECPDRDRANPTQRT